MESGENTQVSQQYHYSILKHKPRQSLNVSIFVYNLLINSFENGFLTVQKFNTKLKLFNKKKINKKTIEAHRLLVRKRGQNICMLDECKCQSLTPLLFISPHFSPFYFSSKISPAFTYVQHIKLNLHMHISQSSQQYLYINKKKKNSRRSIPLRV